jgi:hypothetical protein
MKGKSYIIAHHYMVFSKDKIMVPEHYVMKTYGGMDVQSHVFLTSTLDGGE